MALYIGLISGTSADAIDGVLVDLSADQPRIITTCSLPISQTISEAVFGLAISGNHEIEQMRQLDLAYGQLFGQAALTLCEQANKRPQDILGIGSHGQTIRHCSPSPPSASQTAPGYSLQIGDPNIIVEMTGITVVADFRRRDIAVGGHGAPLAPSLHHALFRSSERDRIILNTGGIANITYLRKAGETIGFDTGPANGLMDSWCQQHLGQAYDRNGEWAATGKADSALLDRLMAHPYFALPVPKSTGREDFNGSWLQQQLVEHDQPLAPEDVQATLLALTVKSITQAIESVGTSAEAEVYICGGGAHNQALCTALSTALQPRLFSNTHVLGIDPDWVEAVAFAWLAQQTLAHKPGNLPSVTGARKPVVLGGIYPA